MTWADFWKIVLGAALALFGGWYGQYLTGAREERKRRLEWRAKQLSEFYAPMFALRKEILALSNLRVRVSEVSDEKYREWLAAVWGPERDPERYQRHKDGAAPYMNSIDHFNKIWEEVLWPAYVRMRELFRERMQYADQDTIDFYDLFIAYLETHNLGKAKLPFEVFADVRTMEAEVVPFYDHIAEKTRQLRESVQSGRLPEDRPTSRYGRLGLASRIKSLT